MNYSTKKELAMAYCPDIDYTAALKKLNQWIRANAELSARLAATGYIPTQRRFYTTAGATSLSLPRWAVLAHGGSASKLRFYIFTFYIFTEISIIGYG